jgi:hypothetical protein
LTETTSSSATREPGDAYHTGCGATFGPLSAAPLNHRRSEEIMSGRCGESNEVHVGFLADRPEAAAPEGLDPRRSPQDEFVVTGREVFLHLPSGVARSTLTNEPPAKIGLVKL